MPRFSRCATLLRHYRCLFLRRVRFGTVKETAKIYSSDEESINELVALSLLDLRCRRYLFPHGNYKESNWHSILDNLDQLSDDQFLMLYGMHRESFGILHDFIKDHHAFRHRFGCHGNLLKQQYPVRLQLLVFLYSLVLLDVTTTIKELQPIFMYHRELSIYLCREWQRLCCPIQVISFDGQPRKKGWQLVLKFYSSMGCQIVLVHCFHFSMPHCYIPRISFQERFLCSASTDYLRS